MIENERVKEIKERLVYLDELISNGDEDMEEYYEAIELHKQLEELAQ